MKMKDYLCFNFWKKNKENRCPNIVADIIRHLILNFCPDFLLNQFRMSALFQATTLCNFQEK